MNDEYDHDGSLAPHPEDHLAAGRAMQRVKTTIQHQERHRCESCGSIAEFLRTYLYENYRTNPASSAFGRDDCSRCSDVKVFVCRDCRPATPPGCDPGYSQFEASAKFAHMFVYWYTDAVN